jgi:hypothetical protein
MQRTDNTRTFPQPLLWFVFVLYIIVAGFTMLHHEPWSDELHSWNIVKGSASYFDLVYNTRYEGHPPLWYSILYPLSRLTHNLFYIQLLHFVIASMVIFLVLFFSPLPTINKALLPFGYYFLFEYAIISRNYAIAVFTAFLLCIILKKEFKYKIVLYYLLIFILSNAHLIAMLLACSIHLYFLLSKAEQKRDRKNILLHLILGVLIILPSIYFILPPSNSQMHLGTWKNSWTESQMAIDIQAPLRAFVPVPAWWKYNFWNTQFLFEIQSTVRVLKFFTPTLAIGFVVLCCYLLKENKKAVVLFFTNVLLTFFAGAIFPLTNERYVGFIFIGFIVAWWLYCSDISVKKNKEKIVTILLVIQLIAGVFVSAKDICLPFSNSYKTKEVISKVPAGEKIVTDISTHNTVSAYMDSSFYCIDIQETIPFLWWDMSTKELLDKPSRYYNGVINFLQREKVQSLYMISCNTPEALYKIDPKLFSLHVEVVYKVESAIEKSSNLYLYRITE